jgi:hypothetical protein
MANTWAKLGGLSQDGRSEDPVLGRLPKLPGFQVWGWGLCADGIAAIVVLVLAIFMSSCSDPHKATPSASRAAPGAYLPVAR